MNILNQQLKNLEDRPIILGDQLGRGGEGSVFAIKNSPNLVAKVYHQTPPRDKAEKILNMVRLGNERLLNLSTWPLASYYSDNGILSGFIMARLINHHSLYELYSPRLRLEKFPKADWRFLVHASMNVARAFKVIHDAGHVIGDVNHGNLVVAQDATVRFIDTDSFQVFDNKKYWFCEVGVSTHQPPEMQGLSTFRGVMRTPNHDNFGLAVLIFQLLFLGRHPFSGRFQGTGEMPLEKAIKEYRFAFSSNNHVLQMLPPPASLSMIALTVHLRLLFERAFSKDSSGIQVGLRPTPDEWITALTTLSAMLKSCFLNSGHYYNKELKACPWCDIESQIGSIVFPVVNVDSTSNFDIATIWQQVVTTIEPGPEPPPPPLVFQPLPPSSKAQTILEELKPLQVYCFGIWCLILLITIVLGHSGSAWVGLMILGTISSISFPLGAIFYYERRKRLLAKDIIESHDVIMQNWENLMNRWKASSSYFVTLRKNINNLKKAYEALSTDREQFIFLQQLDNMSYQLHIHLNRFLITEANIQGIGHDRITTLKHHGIETAADVEVRRLQGIKGFGKVFCTRLINWRQQIEKSFVFNPNEGLSNQDIAAIDKDIATKRQQIATELSTAASQLSAFTKQVYERRVKLALEANELLKKYSQTIADAELIKLSM